jgi:transcription initiation factor TFIIH subunit 2
MMPNGGPSCCFQPPFSSPQCKAKNSDLPTDCAVCGLKLVLAPHLARSFHHLFPVPPFVEVTESRAADGRVTSSANISFELMLQSPLDENLLIRSEDNQVCCFACLRLLAEGSDLLRYQCPSCENLFCVDCDAFLHHSLHNCPGCLCR